MKVVLVHPQIPQNAGNVVRTCAVTGASLTLVEPLGFRPSDRTLKRAGLDYWLGVDATITSELVLPTQNFTFFSSKATQLYTDISYAPDHVLIFGSETDGLPHEFHEKYPSHFATLPMRQGERCLNLSNAVAIALYEAWRQNQFN